MDTNGGRRILSIDIAMNLRIRTIRMLATTAFLFLIDFEVTTASHGYFKKTHA